MNRLLLLLALCLFGLSVRAENPALADFNTNQFLISSVSQPKISILGFTTSTNGVTYVTNVFVFESNAFFTNIITTNLTVNNQFNGKTTITTNLFATNTFITYLTNITAYVTNLFAVTEYVTNLNVTYLTNQTFYTTNLFATTVNTTTNFDTFNFSTNLFSTNIITTNLFATFITNNTFYTTNVSATTVNATTNFVTENFSTNLFSTNIITTNLFSTFITNQTIFTTNVFATTINTTTNISNFNITTNLNVVSNATFNSFTTLSNTYVTNITIFEAQWSTNAWNGPTNNIDFTHGTYQKYKTSTDMLINGLLGAVATNENTTVLLIDPGGADRTLYFPNSWTNFTSDKANAYTIGSTNVAIVTLSQYGQENTNVIVRIWGVVPTGEVWTNVGNGTFILSGDTQAPTPLFSILTNNGSGFSVAIGLQGANITGNDGALGAVSSYQLYANDSAPTLQFKDSSSFRTLLDPSQDDGDAAYVFDQIVFTAGFDNTDFRTNGTPIAKLSTNGVFTAHGLVDDAFAANGVVTNDSAGLLHTTPTLPNSLLSGSGQVTVNGTANHITTTSATIALGGSATLDVGSSVDLIDLAQTITASKAFTKTNYEVLNFTTSTNQNQITPDFSVAEQLISTNAAFTFLAPVGVDSGKVEAQWTLVHVTNTTASAVLITSPANCHTVGTAYVTNWTDVWFNCYAQKITNAFYVPVF